MRKFIFLLAMTLAVMLSTTNGWGQDQTLTFNFENGITGWSSNGSSQNGQLENTTGGRNGSMCLRFNGYSFSSYYDYLYAAIPLGDIDAINVTSVSGYCKIYGDTYDKLEFGYNTGDNTTYTKIQDLSVSQSWNNFTITINNLPQNAKQLVFKYIGWYYGYLDDIEIQATAPASSCPKPKDLAITPNSITPNGATITWTAGGTESNWILSYSSDGGTTWNDVNVSTTPEYTFSNLTKETTYKVKVKADCGTTDGQSGETSPIEFTTPPTCPAVTNVQYSNITATSADITWTETGAATSWQYTCVPSGETPTSWTTTSQTSVTLNNLTAATEYDFYVKADCGDEQSSNAKISFETLCGIETLPYTENFDTWENISKCWSSGCSVNWMGEHPTIESSGFTGKSLALYNNNYYSNYIYSYAILPELENSENGYIVSFKSKTSDITRGKLLCGLMTPNYSQFHQIESFTITNSVTYSDYSFYVDIETFTEYYNQYGVQPRIAFKSPSPETYEYADTYIYIDNINIQAGSPCKPVKNLQVSDIMVDGATVAWTAGGSETSWKYICVESGQTPVWDNAQTAESTTLNLTGLTAGTNYDIYVKADCGSEQSSETKKSFTTELCNPSQQCEITIEMQDSYGDGWNEAHVDIVDKASSNIVASFTLGAGSNNGVANAQICKGRECNIVWVDKYFYGEESFTIKDGNNNIIFSQSRGITSGTLTSFTPNCVTCHTPTISSNPETTTTDATFSWTAGESEETQWQYACVARDEAPSNWTITSETSATISDLTPGTNYDFYVRAYCSADDQSEADKKQFTTLATCQAVTNISSSNVTATSAEISWTAGGSETEWEVEYKTSSEENWTSTGSHATSNSYSFSSLTPNTYYQVRVRAYCNADDQSSWTEDYFKTLNNATAITSLDVNNMIGNAVIDNTNHTVTATVRADVELASIQPNIYASSGASIYYNDAKYEYGTIDFSQGAVTFTVKAQDETYTQDWTITIQHEACATPYDVTINNVERVRATINWDIAGEDAKDYEFIVSENQIYDFSESVATHTLSSSTEKSFVLENLNRGTEYYAYMRHTCGSDGNSGWVSAGSSFTTGSLVDCQTKEITESSSINVKIPLYTYNYYSKSQQIYTKKELNDLGFTKGNISAVAFKYTFSTKNVSRTIDVAIGTTTDDCFASSNYYTTTNVATSKNIQFTYGSWGTINFDNPYHWDGESNIVVEIYGQNTNEYTSSGYNVFSGATYTKNMSAYNHSDSDTKNSSSPTLSNDRAFIQISFCNENNPCPEVKSITATGDKHKANVSWTPDVVDYLSQYEVVISENGELTDFTGITPDYSGTETSAEITGLEVGTYYAYVRCVCGHGDGESEWVRSESSFEVLSNCDPVTGLSATENGLITWTAAAETSYNLQYRMKGAEAWTAVTEGIDNGECPLTGLAMHTTYEVRIQADCGGEDQSNWSEPVEFTTPCGEITITKAEPYVYGFEDAENGALPCWTKSASSQWFTLDVPEVQTNYGTQRTGYTAIRFRTMAEGNFDEQKIITPVITNEISTLEFTLWAKRGVTTSTDIKLEIGVIDENGTYTGLQVLYINSTDYKEYTASLASAPANSKKIAISCLPNSYNEIVDIYVDDITIGLAPTCKKPTAISIENITYNGAEVNVTAEETDFEYVVSTSAIDVENIQDGDINTSSTNPIVLTGLAEETTYYVAVRCSCGTDDKSDWTVMNTPFTTAAQCYPIASDITVGGDNSQVILSWTAPTSATGYKYILSESELPTPDFTTAETVTTASKTFAVGGQGNLKGETDYWFYVKNDCNEGAHANDYKSVSFTTPETCPSPKDVTVTDVQKYQFTIEWEKSEFATDDQEYELIVNTTGEQPDIEDEAQVDEITGTNYTIENLARNTHYYVYMRGTCDDVPEWKLVAEETTLGLGTICDGTETIGTGSENTNMVPFSGLFTGLSYKSQIIYTADKLQNLNGKQINGMKFYAKSGNNSSWNGAEFAVRIGTTTSSQFTSYAFLTETLEEVYNNTAPTNTNNEINIVFENNKKFQYNGGNILIEIELTNIGNASDVKFASNEATGCSYYEGKMYDWMPSANKEIIDQLPKVTFTTCEEVKACPEVSNLKETEVTHKSAKITWDASDGDLLTGYEFAWGDEAITDFSQVQTRTIGKNEDREVRLDHLTPSTTYYVYVRALCPAEKNLADQQSNWVSRVFTTDEFNCDAPAETSVTLNDMFPESIINVHWTPNEKQIELYYTTDDGFEPTSETEANENVTSSDIELGFHAITGLTVNTTYYVWARTVCDLDMGNDGKSVWTLMGSATTEADYKDITYENVTYTISGIHQGEVTIMSTSYNESDLVESDYDITYSTDENGTPDVTNYFNYKHVINVPDKFTDGDKQYNVFGIYASAFDNSNLTQKVRVNIPLNKVEYQSNNDKVIISFPTGDSIRYKGTKYYASKAYKINLCDEAEIVQRPFGDQTLKISCPDDEEGTDEDGVVTTQTGARLDFEEGWTETQASTSNMLEASLDEEESVITATRLNKVCITTEATGVNIAELEGFDKCEELKFQTDVTGGAENRKYPECTINNSITLNDTKVKVEMKLNNKEYYYFALPFGCDIDDIKVVAGGEELLRSNSVEEAAEDAEYEHRYVLLTWDESEYDGETSGYVALGESATELEANKGYAILIMESYVSWVADHNVTVDATATFTANRDYTEMVSTSESVGIATTRYDYTSENAYSGWNLVGNPYYSTIKGSWYSYNQYARKINFDRGGTDASVTDYKPDVPVFNVDIKPFETLFVQKDDGAGEGTLTVGNPTLQNTQQAPAVLPEYITITLNDNERMMDRTTIINNDMASDGYMQKEDLIKSHLSSNEIYTTYYDIDFSFNEMNIEEGKKIIPVGVKVANEGDYTIALSEELTNYGIGNVVLHDKTLNKFTTLSDGEEETLHLGKGRTDGRLELIITVNETITAGEDIDDNGKVEVFVNNGIATINGAETGAIVMITDATGKTIYTTEATGDRIDYEFAVRGVYMITVRGEKVSTMKVVY